VQNSLQLAAVYLEQGQTSEAKQLVDQVAKQSPNDPKTLLFRGRLRVEQDQVQEGINDMLRAAQLQPNWALPKYFLGLAYIRQGKLDVAEASLNAAAQLQADFLAPRLLLAQLALDEGKPERAMSAIEKTVDQKPQFVQPYVLRSLALMEEGHYDEAEKDTEQLIDEFPQPADRAMSYRTLAWANFHQKRFEQAHSFAKESLKYEAASQEGLYLLGATQISLNKPDGAVSEVEGYVRSNPNWAPGYVTLAQMQAATGHLADAERSLQKALDMDPSLVDAQTLWSDVEVSQGKTDQAMALLSKLAQSHPKLPEPQIRLGQLSETKQDWKAAESYYSKAIELAPGDPVAKNNLAWVYAEHGGNIDLALKLAQDAKEIHPDDPNISDTLAWIMVKKENYATAIQLLRDCVQKDPKNASFNYHLGVAYYRAGRKPEAEQALEAALRLQPNFSDAGSAKQILEALRKDGSMPSKS
jgi:tetratricopeptide (TPR) repeat protein